MFRQTSPKSKKQVVVGRGRDEAFQYSISQLNLRGELMYIFARLLKLMTDGTYWISSGSMFHNLGHWNWIVYCLGPVLQYGTWRWWLDHVLWSWMLALDTKWWQRWGTRLFNILTYILLTDFGKFDKLSKYLIFLNTQSTKVEQSSLMQL